jgi:glycosyltransferase involved in cell wall biosynthesis
MWHGWLLEGSGSNVATARTAEIFRAEGHDVVLLCQERHPERFAWIDGSGVVDRDGPRDLRPNPVASEAPGRCTLLRPEIGSLLPVFVLDPYEGFEEVRRFVDLTDVELDRYLDRNVEALGAAAGSHEPDAAFTGHAVPGAVIGHRALGPGRYVAKIHGSDLEYAIRPQERYRRLAREGLETASAVVGPTLDTLARCAALVPEMSSLARVVAPGVDVTAFRPLLRRDALLTLATRLEADPAVARGRPTSLDHDVEAALESRDLESLVGLADRYEHEVPDPEAAARLRGLATEEGPVVGYLGKLIPQKGVELLLQALPALGHEASGLVVGFGSGREWLVALVAALRRGDERALAWLRDEGGLAIEPSVARSRAPDRAGVLFTGMLDHRYAPAALAAMDVQVVPSILDEAFGIVAAEGAAAGALPLVSRHSGLAEVAAALEDDVDRPGSFSFEPGPGAAVRIAQGIERLLEIPADERAELRDAVSSFVRRHWTWERTAAALLDIALTP